MAQRVLLDASSRADEESAMPDLASTHNLRARLLARLGVLLLAAALPVSARAATPDFSTPEGAAVQIHEWIVPWPNTRPRDPSVGADGRIWFVGQLDNYLAVFNPDTAEFRRIELPPGTRPHTVVVSPEGEPWVAGNGNGTLLRYSAAGELLETIEVPAPEGERVRDPHTLAFDGRGGLWFTMQQSNAIGHLGADGELLQVAVPTAQARPYGIKVDARGDAWVVLFGVAKLAQVKRADMALREVELPRPLARPRRMAIADDGAIWYVDYAADHLGRFDPKSDQIREWPLEPRPAAPYAMAKDREGRLWFFYSGQQPNLLRGFEPESGEMLDATPVPSGGITVRHAEYHAPTRSIWFGTDANTLGRAVVPEWP
jgi:virginiamycin B lyase